MPFQLHRRRGSRQGESGYALMILLLTMALIAIAAGAIASSIKFQIQRDREEEMIHRGVQYSRAIRGYYKKFGRYPVKMEDLDNTSNIKFLRKRYKDPITGQDWHLLYMGDVKLTFGTGIPGVQSIGSPGVAMPSSASNGQNSTFGGSNTFGSNNTFGGGNTLGGNGVSSFGTGQAGGQITGVTGVDPSQSTSATGTTGTGNDSSGNITGDNNSNSTGTTGNSGSGSGSGSGPGSGSGNQVFGGGPIVGVVSTSKKDTIREFNHKHHYNEWQFIYDPGTDRGGLLMTPNQPPLLPQQQNPNGTNNNGTPNGSSPTGFQNNYNQQQPPPTTGTDSSNPPQPQ